MKHVASVGARRLFLLVTAAAVVAAAACSDSSGTSVTADKSPPTVSLAKTSSADSVVAFQVSVKDNLGIKSIHVAVTGGVTKTFDTTFTSANTDATIPFAITAPASVPRGSLVFVTASAIDGAGNQSQVDSLSLTVGNLAPPEVKITSPASGTFAVVGKSIIVSVSGKSGVKIRSLGLNTTGAVTRADSIVFNSPLRDSVAIQDTVLIPANATPGALLVTPFVIDSLGTRTTGPAITITVQTAAQSNSVPTVSFGLTPRVEVTDTIHVEAGDQAGIISLGYEVRRTVGGALDVADSITSNGQITSAIKTFTMRLPYTTFPTIAYVQAFARNSNNIRSYAKLAGGADRVDTVTVVAGVTHPLPLGGTIADALYHPRKDRIYLSNISLGRVEVFDLRDSSFKAAIAVGSRPWGLAAWPRDRSGTMGDTLLVANSGGTDISYVNLNDVGITGTESGREKSINYNGTTVSRYPLPNIIVYSVTTVTSATTGLPIAQRTKYDFSDRPQFIGTTCKDAGGGLCGDVLLTLTTTPTGGQSSPFANNNGTVRWENLTQQAHTYSKSHFFFEQAIGQSTGRADTLEIIRYDALDPQDSTVLVPYKQTAGGLSFSVVVRLPEIAFRDTTYLRASGNFLRAVMAEGGPILGSRAMTFDVSKGFALTAPGGSAFTTPYKDLGVSDASAVSDQVANSNQQVTAAAINFDGSLNAVRGDSTYLFNPSLRLQGMFPTTLGNSGLDFHPTNVGPNSFPTPTRLAFAASTQPIIEIYDSHCYQLVGTIPIRDPIIGPIKAALRPLTGELVLVGATARGLVIAALPNTFTTTCP